MSHLGKPSGRPLHFAKLFIPCSEHGGHRVILGSVDDTSHLLADVLKRWHHDHGMRCLIDYATVDAEAARDATEGISIDDLPF